MENNNNKTNDDVVEKKKTKTIILVLVCLVIIISVSVFVTWYLVTQENNEMEVVTVSSLEKVIEVSELSTLSTVYNGVAEVRFDENSDNIDYYVAYNATVKAGINFEDISISIDNTESKIYISIPEVQIMGIDIEQSFKYIYVTSKAEKNANHKEALIACENDVKQESEKTEAIYELAKQNTINTIIALTEPLIEQLDTEYELIVE